MAHPPRRISDDRRAQMMVLRETLESLQSTKIKNRNDGMDNLSRILSDRDACKILDENHHVRLEESIDTLKWQDVFRSVETAFGKEFETKDGADASNTKQKKVIDLLQKVVFAANRNPNQPYLDRSLIFRTVKFIVVPSIFEAYSHQVIEIVNHYLSVPTYVATTGGTDWAEFLSKVIKLLVSQLKKEKVPPQFLYEITIKGIVHGSNYPGVISLLRTRVVDFFMFSIASKNNSIFRERCVLIMEAFIQLCQLNAVEARGILCTSGVILVAHIINSNCIETPDQQDKACELFLLQLKLHAPFDLDYGVSFYTENQTSWEEVIEKLFNFCKQAIEDVALKRKQKSKNQKNVQIPHKLLQLAVKCTKFYNINKVKTPVMMEDDACEPPSKRAKVLSPFDQIVEQALQMNHSVDQLTWLTYIGAVLLKYPRMMEKVQVFESLLKVGRSLLNSNYLEFEEVFTFLRSLLYCERYLVEAGILSDKSDSWDHIWDILVKSFAVREATPESLIFLKDILLHCQPKNIGLFTSLFANNALPLCLTSLDLVREYLSCCHLPSSLPSVLPTGGMMSSARLSIIKWLIPSLKRDINTDIERLIPTIIYGLLVKRTNYVILTECGQRWSKTETSSSTEDFEKVILKSSFVPEPKDLLTDNIGDERRMQMNLIQGAGEFLDVNGIVVPFLEYLQADLSEFPEINPNKSSAVKLMQHLLFRTKLFLNLLDLFFKYPVQDSEEFRPTMETLFETAFDHCGSVLSKYLVTETKMNRIYSVLCVLNTLLQSQHLGDESKNLLSTRFPRVLLDKLMSIVRKNCTDQWDPNTTDEATEEEFRVSVGGPDSLEDDTLTEGVSKSQHKQLITLEALKCICDYSHAYDGRSELLYTLVEIILANAGQNSSHNFFDVCYVFISRAHPVFVSCDSSLVSKVIELVQILCQRFRHNAICTSSLWRIFKDLIPTVCHFEEGHKFMILVGNMAKFMNLQGIQSCLSYLDLMEKLSEFDPELSWTHFVPRKGNNEIAPQKKYPLLELQTFLSSKPPCHQIRLEAIHAICCVFKHFNKPLCIRKSPQSHNGADVDMEVSAGNEKDLISPWFVSVKEALYEMYNASTKLVSSEKKEEGVNCVAIAVYGCTQIAFSNEFMEQPGLYLLMEIMSSKNIKQELATQALERASPHALKAMKLYAPLNLNIWIKNNLKPENVPYRLFGCASQQNFYAAFSKYMIIHLFIRFRLDILDELAVQMKSTRAALVKACFNEIYGRLISTSILGGSSSVREADSAVDILKKSIARDAGGVEVSFESTVTDRLHELAMELLSCLYEKEVCTKWGCAGIVLPQVVPYPLNEYQVRLAWNWLRQQAVGVDTHIAYHLAKTSHASIYNMLLELTTRVHDAHNYLIRLWRLHHLSFFVTILTEVSVGSFIFVKSYLCNFVIHSYLRLLVLRDSSDTSNIFLQSVLFHLRAFINRLMDLDYEEMQQYYKLIIHKLVSMTSSHPQLQDAITATLNVLLVENHEKFRDTIRTLDPFPDLEIFKDYSRIVTQNDDRCGGFTTKLKLVLANVKNSGYICTSETLQYTRKLIEMNKEDFAILVKELEGKRFKDECADDPIHNLIHLLISVINKAEDVELDREACKCLGEIGPIDLSLLVLPVYGQQFKITSSSSAPQALLDLVTSCLEDSDIHVVSTTTGVLQKLLESNDCSYFIISAESDPRLASILKPFRSRGRKMWDNSVQIAPSVLTTLKEKLPIDDTSTYIDWVTSFTCTLIDCISSKDSILACVKPLCLLKTEFCEEILPYVLFAILEVAISDPVVRKTMTNYFCNFFSRFVDITSGAGYTQGMDRRYSLYTNKSALRILIRCVQFLRQHPTPQDFRRPKAQFTTKWNSNFWLEFNYLHIAKAAQFCGAYLTSILFGEIYALEAEPTQVASVASSSRPRIPASNAFPRETRAEIEKLLLKAFTNIGEPDGVFGCGSARFLDFASQIEHLQSTQSWDQVLSAEDFNGGKNEKLICVSLKEKGLYNSLWTQLHGIDARRGYLDEQLLGIQYECAWRLSNWDLNMNKVSYIRDTVEFNTAASGSGQQFIYESIQSAVRKNWQKFDQAIKRSYEVVLTDLRHANLESSENLYGFLSQLQMVRLVEDMSRLNDDNFDAADSKWKHQFSMRFADFKYLEPVLSVKKVMLHALYIQTQNNVFETACDDTLFRLVQDARDSGRVELAEKYTLEISDSLNFSIQKSVEKAKNYKLRGNDDISRQIIDQLLKNNSPETTTLYPTLLLLQGEWLLQSFAELNSVISKDFFQLACEICEKNKSKQVSQEDIAKAHITLAEFADTQFQKLRDHIHSELFREKAKLLARVMEDEEEDVSSIIQPKCGRNTDEEIARLKNSSDKDARTTHCFLTKQGRMDRDEIHTTHNEKDRYQHMALDNYLKGLELINKYDIFIFRVIALWLEASGGNPKVGIGPSKLDEAMGKKVIPSYKYIPVLHQLSGRLGTNSPSTATLLDEILIKCAKEHPYQTLPVLLSQALLHRDKEINKIPKRTSDSSENRVKAARALIDILKRQKKNDLNILVNKMEICWNALISFAYFVPTQKTTEQRHNIPNNHELLRVDDVPVPTLNVPANPSGVYKDVVCVKKFKNFFYLVGGINAPKRLICQGKNGLSYNLLVKGNDDLRQDAVMQQVFGVMNQLLAQEPKTRKKRLHIRTYKVVPLSQRSGVLEWCENTQTFGDYLVGGNPPKGGAHVQYRPNDWHPTECRKKMQDKKSCGNTTAKLEAFNEIIANFKPVFHHFFFENFIDSGSFFERRLAYTRSVATSSIVGYILGLGDRHVQNILIDKTTAEFIHIDFGVAFDQGKLLPTPETIPFRLTRDVVDGMGFCGIEGVFRRSCESTMEVLRKNADIIVTILEVLLYDPLYLWTLSEEHKHKLQAEDRSQAPSSRFINNDSTAESESRIAERNNTAARELRRLRCKLAGIQEGRTSGYTMTVPGHVSQLINLAMDASQLSRLFPGWQPYL